MSQAIAILSAVALLSCADTVASAAEAPAPAAPMPVQCNSPLSRAHPAFEIARACNRDDQLLQAVDAYRVALRTDERTTALLAEYADVLQRLGRTDQAAAIFGAIGQTPSAVGSAP